MLWNLSGWGGEGVVFESKFEGFVAAMERCHFSLSEKRGFFFPWKIRPARQRTRKIARLSIASLYNFLSLFRHLFVALALIWYRRCHSVSSFYEFSSFAHHLSVSSVENAITICFNELFCPVRSTLLQRGQIFFSVFLFRVEMGKIEKLRVLNIYLLWNIKVNKCARARQ